MAGEENMNELEKIIYERENSLLQPEVRKSKEMLNNLLAEDFQEFGSSGLIYDKQSVLDRLPSNTDVIEYQMSNFAIKIIAENIVQATFKIVRTINATEKATSLRSSLWRREENDWRIFFHQGTPTK